MITNNNFERWEYYVLRDADYNLRYIPDGNELTDKHVKRTELDAEYFLSKLPREHRIPAIDLLQEWLPSYLFRETLERMKSPDYQPPTGSNKVEKENEETVETTSYDRDLRPQCATGGILNRDPLEGYVHGGWDMTRVNHYYQPCPGFGRF